jgi:hypothetical protein
LIVLVLAITLPLTLRKKDNGGGGDDNNVIVTPI